MLQPKVGPGVCITRISRALLSSHLATTTQARFASSNALEPLDTYKQRHNGTDNKETLEEMLKVAGTDSMDELIAQIVPEKVLLQRALNVEPKNGFSESQLLARVRELANKNKLKRSFIGRGYYGTLLPAPIQRNLLENPQWYTSYTPYQPEISQGRLESLVNFQTMVADLTGLDIANASLLDEATAAGEAMIMAYHQVREKKNRFYVDTGVWPHTIDVLHSRAKGLGIKVVVGTVPTDLSDACGVLVQYPSCTGEVASVDTLRSIGENVHKHGGVFCVAADILSLALLPEPGSFGADIALGSTQRFGVPMGYGGPHAAYFAVKDSVKRKIPGRLVGRSVDRLGNPAYRLALQTREQHIRREKATSNICTAQALLANISAMYAVYHGPQGIRAIASRVYSLTSALAKEISKSYAVVNKTFFDTLTVDVGNADSIIKKALEADINLYKVSEKLVSVSLDETVTAVDFAALCRVFGAEAPSTVESIDYPNARAPTYLKQQVFNKYHSETELLRYMSQLQNKDYSLANCMIPLGSCTMKLNAAVTMMPITWPEFSQPHPFVPADQVQGYLELIQELEHDLADITGFAATSLQPNSGAQGEFTGLKVIRAYHESRGEADRNICLIPVSAHGTNPASAVMAGMKVVSIKCNPNGDLDLEDLSTKAQKHADKLAAFMITYPSTFGVYEPTVLDAIDIVHKNGGQIYMDGANMNAQIGLTSPGALGADVCHLNLHKTFCIPHGGGGPGVGPICVAKHLVDFLPGHVELCSRNGEANAVSAAPFGSASILPIPWAYIKLMGATGLRSATEVALLNANYMKSRLEPYYKIVYANNKNRCAHEFIIDLRPFKSGGVEAIDVAKRLQDYGFHAPTFSWPVVSTLMVEPTESESKAELDRFCDAMISIHGEIQDVVEGRIPYKGSVLANAPHSTKDLLQDEWNRSYTREKAAYPVESLKHDKLWPAVTRVDDAYGDTHLFCSCDPVESSDS